METSVYSIYSFQKVNQNKLGEGGFGAVYSGTLKDDPTRSVAIKIIEGRNNDMKMKEIFIMNTLKHSHIVKIIDFSLDSQKNEAIIVMEKATKSLSKLIKENENGFNKQYLLQIFLDILTGLHYAHKEKNISHSDIKPANVLFFENVKREEKAQKTWVFNENHIFKLSDWGGGKIEENVMATRTLNANSNVLSEAYAAPELLDTDKIKANPAKIDIYSLGLCILTCCGVLPKHFGYLGRLNNDIKHDKDLVEIMEKHKINGKYGKKFFELLRNMIRYNSKDRIDYDEIFKRIEEIIKEIQEEQNNKKTIKYKKVDKKEKFICQKCNLYHKNGLLRLNCEHNIGVSCIKNHIIKGFEANALYFPFCPIENCKFPLEMKIIKEVLKEKLNKYYKKCDFCEIISYKQLFLQISCDHEICRKCFENKNIIKVKICPIKECLKVISEKMCSQFKEFKKKCIHCQNAFEDKNSLFKMRCCHNTLCEDCLRINVLEPRKKYKENVKDYQKSDENQREIYDLCCFLCRKDLKNLSMSTILNKRSFELYKKIIKNKGKCKICLNMKDNSRLEKLSSCEHVICKRCLKNHVKTNVNIANSMVCCVEKCGKVIDKTLVQKYLQKIKSNEFDVSSKESEPFKFNKNSETKLIISQNFDKLSSEEFKSETTLEKKMCVRCYRYFLNKCNEILYIPECEHAFCNECIHIYIKENNYSIRCYANNCKTMLKPEDLKLIVDALTYTKIEESIKKNNDSLKIQAFSTFKKNQNLLSKSLINPNEDDVKMSTLSLATLNDLISIDPNLLKEISFDKLKSVLSKDLFEKYENLLMKKIQIQNEVIESKNSESKIIDSCYECNKTSKPQENIIECRQCKSGCNVKLAINSERNNILIGNIYECKNCKEKNIFCGICMEFINENNVIEHGLHEMNNYAINEID